MPTIGQPAAQRQAERARRAARNSYISNFKEAETLVRWLWEDPARVWVTFYYHFHYAKKISYPCMRGETADDGTKILYCLGCTWPADENMSDEEKDKDPNWRVRRANFGIAAPALTLKTVDGDPKEYLDIYQIGVTLWDSLKVMYRENATVTSRDMKVIRTDDGKTKYTPMEKGDPGPRKYVVELRDLLRECAPGMSAEQGTPEYKAAWDRWRAGNVEIGIPDVNQILIRKYAEAADAYGVTVDELTARNEEMLVADGQSRQNIADLKAKAQAAKTSAGVTPAVPVQPATPAAAPAEQADQSGDLPIDQLANVPMKALVTLAKNDIDTVGKLIAWSAAALVELGVDEAQLTPIRMALAGLGLELDDEPGATAPAAGQPDPVVAAQIAGNGQQQEATVHQLPASAGQQLAAAQTVADTATATDPTAAVGPDGVENFDAWDTPDIRDWLTERRVDFPEKAPRSVLIGFAKRHAGMATSEPPY